MPDSGEWAALAGAVLLDVTGYYTLTRAMRMGDVAVITPFRYTRILFAIVIGAVVFRENPDLWTILGGAIIIVSGLYTFARENRQKA